MAQGRRLRFSRRWRSLRMMIMTILLAIAVVTSCLLSRPTVAQPPQPAPALVEYVGNPEALIQQAQQRYTSGQYGDALLLLQRAVQVYQEGGNWLRQALALSNLSLTHQQLAQWEAADEAIEQSLALVNLPVSNNGQNLARLRVLAQAQAIQAQLQFNRGQAAEAIATWENAAASYDQLGDRQGYFESQWQQSQALQALGLYRQAEAILRQLVKAIEVQESLPSTTYVASLRSLGDVLLVVGDLPEARRFLSQSLEVAQRLQDVPREEANEAIAASYLSLGNLARTEADANLALSGLSAGEAIASLKDSLNIADGTTAAVIQQRKRLAADAFYQKASQALELYQKAAELSAAPALTAQSQLAQFKLSAAVQQWEGVRLLYPALALQLQNLQPTHSNLTQQLEFVQTVLNLESNSDLIALTNLTPQLEQILKQVEQQSTALGDRRLQSFAIGTLGRLNANAERLTDAEMQTRQALGLSQSVKADDISYRWQWQLGRILKSQERFSEAIEAYEISLSTLQALRRDLITTNLSYQLAFRADAEEPIYRELIDLLLREEQPGQDNLRRSRAVATSLQVAKLENFLGEPCANSNPELIDRTVDRLAANTAFIYPIALRDRLEVIVKLPLEPALYHFRTQVSLTELEEIIQALQLDLEQEYTFDAIRAGSQHLYDWIIRPIQAQLAARQVDTLIFALDDPLRTVPMAALFDGEKYLIESYATAVTLGLDLPNPARLARDRLKVLAVGLTDPPTDLVINSQNLSANFSKLANINIELDAIAASGISTTTIRDQAFTQIAFNRKINEASFPIVHLATHGQFSSDPGSTFLLTSDGAIQVDALSQLFEARGESRPDSIELLILNACETAAGDQLATLGIAGTAFRAGARSVIASLWTLDDTSSVELTRQFYRNLMQADLSKVQALRRAQIALLNNPQYKHPRYWATYVFVGNWL